MAEMTPEKMQAQEEANQRTDWERQRLEYYLGLRYSFNPINVDYWLDSLFDQQKQVYKPRKNPSWNQIRKEAGIGFWDNFWAFTSEEKKKEVEKKKAASKAKLQAEVDEYNAAESNRCDAYNTRLRERLVSKLNRFTSHSPEEVEEFFTFALNQDDFALDGRSYYFNFNLIYDPEKQQLVIDYKLPLMDQVSRIKEWRVDKDSNIVPIEMNKMDYLAMYERVLMDLSMRTIGMLFESDSNNVLSSIVFNGSCLYNDWQKIPTILLSFVFPKSQYSYDRICRMDCSSKGEIAKLKEVNYLDDIRSPKAAADLWDTPPVKQVMPIRSSF